MAGRGVDAMMELRSQLQEKKVVLLRQVEEERRRVASLEQESDQVHCDYHSYKHYKQELQGALFSF